MHSGYGSGNGVHGLNVALVDLIRRRKSLQSLMSLLHRLQWRLLLQKYPLLTTLCSPREIISTALLILGHHESLKGCSEHSEYVCHRDCRVANRTLHALTLGRRSQRSEQAGELMVSAERDREQI